MLKGIPNRREVLAWGTYDLANQSFQLLINTLLFAVYIREVVADDLAQGERWWMGMSAAAMLIIVALSPILGAIADLRAWKREILLTTGVLCAVLTAALALAGHGMLAVAAALYIPASVACGVGENFLGSFLPEIADEKSMGRVSAIGWTMSYIGALALMACMAAATKVLGIEATSDFRWLFIFAGAWFLAWMMPAVLILREKARPRDRGLGSVVGAGVRRFASTLAGLGRFRVLGWFLAIFFVYSMGTQVFVFLSGVITKQMDFSNQTLFIVALEVSFLAGVGAVIAASKQDSWGHRRTVRIFLGVWVASMAGLAIMAWIAPTPAVFYVLSAGAGLGLGGIGTASRALVGVLTPASRAGEFFGLWGMTYKLSGACAMGLFLALESIVVGSPALFLAMTAGFFAAGWLLMGTVDVTRGMATAREAEGT